MTLLLVSSVAVFGADEGKRTSQPSDDSDRVVLERLQNQSQDNPGRILFFNEEERRVAFANISKLYPTRQIPHGSRPYSLTEKPKDWAELTYEVDGKSYGLADFYGFPGNRGLIVIQDDAILLERYAKGHGPDTRWMSFSVTKSVTSMLIGAAIKDGYIESVDEPVVHYLPRLRQSPYAGASIQNVLQMASGVSWNEDYADPESDVARAGGANGLFLVKYLGNLPKVAEPGHVFNYNTGETNLAGELLRAAIGNNASTYLALKVWQPFGMADDADWLLGQVGGGETGGCCISATLRDYARLGIFALAGGRLEDGTEVLPAGWMAESTRPSRGYAGYGYLWWLADDNSFAALGIFEQQIFVDRQSRLVIAAHSNAPTAVASVYGKHLEALTLAIRETLQ
ncbi:MAG TPA: class A beta-lactamase-related serine hydrolase [Gammaproteobacteria bacterium]|nr:class A beta-lactamase-related serine hydrolase [Gammaproteobacteria bacterium]HIK69632.1 class A beta-lactamase-related serine hydrolase [Pseudomonadales bacterium]